MDYDKKKKNHPVNIIIKPRNLVVTPENLDNST